MSPLALHRQGPGPARLPARRAPLGKPLGRGPALRVARAQPARPAVLRLATGTFSAVHNIRRRPMFRRLHRQEGTQFTPVGVVRVLKKPLPPKLADALFDAAQAVNLAATLGIGHRVTGPLNAALQLWTISYRNSWTMLLHNDNMMTMHQMVLGVTRSADALSVDALLVGLGITAVVLPLRVGVTWLQRRLLFRDSTQGAMRVSVALAPTLVFTLVLAEILHAQFAIPGALFGGLVLYTVLNTMLPSLLLHQTFDIDPLDARPAPAHPEDAIGASVNREGSTPPSSPPGPS